MTTTPSRTSSRDSSDSTREVARGGAGLIYRLAVGFLALTNGAAILSMETLGGRILQPEFGSGLYVWGSILSVFMVSLAIGYWAGGKLSARGATLGRLMIFPIAGGCMIYALPYVYTPLNEALFDLVVIEWGSRESYASLLAAAAEFLVPSAVLGCVAPYSVRLLATTVATTGRTAGNLYALSTVGSAAGALVTSFWLVPWRGAESLFHLLGGGLAAVGVLGLVASLAIGRHRES